MARLNYIPPFTGTVGPVTIYYMREKYFVRTRSSLTAKRVKKDPAFRNFMKHADWMAVASPIASAVYWQVPPPFRKKSLFRKLVGQAQTWLKYGWKASDVYEYLLQQYAGVQVIAEEEPPTPLRKHVGGRGGSANATIKNLSENDECFELRAWRQRDKQFRVQYCRPMAPYDRIRGLPFPA
ncbi:hypothetical protein [Paraflavitalea sp. CAU 1676]|uniref:hypothetical protein n=1 Tax=Paraflavitalea sp. CAU 1676 TaxID=3032598 RepID=UPI0023DBEC35|nr:hypothetical protein [Paraflavitalea sp. CAU 1676]MDF2191855.1 hypothetical protein [Paraflavitalea sp. CAU 1676]